MSEIPFRISESPDQLVYSPEEKSEQNELIGHPKRETIKQITKQQLQEYCNRNLENLQGLIILNVLLKAQGKLSEEVHLSIYFANSLVFYSKIKYKSILE